MPNIIGIDVSTHNGTLDWAALKKAGVQYAIIRTGYGRYAQDSQFKNNISGALAQGIPVGVYHFSYALNAAAAKEEAQFCCSLLKNYKVTFPVFYDFEYDTIRYANDNGITLGKQQFNDFSVAFCEEVRTQGYKAGVYYNLDYKNTFVDATKLGNYTQWYAQYASKSSWSGYDIWQYSSTGTFSGVSGKFDVNILADTSLLPSTATNTITSTPIVAKTGWQKDSSGWKYVHTDGTYTKSNWEQIGGKWYYFNVNGYMLADQWVQNKGNWYYFDANGTMTTNQRLEIDSSGKLIPCTEDQNSAIRYYRFGDISNEIYKSTINKLIENKIINGREGSGDDLVIDLSEDAIRILVYLDRCGMFNK